MGNDWWLLKTVDTFRSGCASNARIPYCQSLKSTAVHQVHYSADRLARCPNELNVSTNLTAALQQHIRQLISIMTFIRRSVISHDCAVTMKGALLSSTTRYYMY